jgi:DNA polymerase-3 subunit gamma/tau
LKKEKMVENFIVSARKYRPSTFNTVVGQSHITNTLKKAITTNHLAQAYLFTGPRGVGKTTCARILAKSINCENLQDDGEACNECNSCKTFNEQRSMNIYELDAASNNSVEDIRALVDQVRFPPQTGKYKVYIIDEVHMLSQSAFNAFLKTLEEPPSYAIFILATTEKHKIIPTILSRCQIFDFNRIQVKDIIEHLKFISEKENVKSEEEALHIIGQKADGALRDALTIFDRIVSFTNNEVTYQFVIDNLNIIDYEYYFKATDFIIEKDIASSLLQFDQLLNLGFEGINYLSGLSNHFRNLLVSQTPQTIQLLELPDNVKERYLEQSKKTDKSLVLSVLNILNSFLISYKESKNQRLHTELALIKLCHIRDAINLTLEAKGQKKKLVNTEKPPQPQPEKKVEEKKVEEAPQQKEIEEQTVKNNSKKSKYDLSNYQQEIIQKEAETKSENGNTQETKVFSKEDFMKGWNDYVENHAKKESANLYTALKSHPVEIDSPIVNLTFENKALENLFIQEKINISDFLLENYEIQNIIFKTQIKVRPKEETTKYITNPKEKYELMAQTNPALRILQEKLGLQPNE